MEKLNVAILGATGVVGQRFVSMLEKHPYFNVKILAASSKSKGKKYALAIENRWILASSIPTYAKNLIMYDVVDDLETICNEVDFVFCALDMETKEIKSIEEKYAKRECPVISNNSANRFTEDVPMIIPELNYEHMAIINSQKKRLNTKKGFIAVKSNCSLQSYLPPIYILKDYEISKILVSTYQAISGAGKTFNTYPDMLDNIIPYIEGEEEKSEKEPIKILATVENEKLIFNNDINVTTQCLRVPVSDGHMASVFVSFKNKPTISEIKNKWNDFNITLAENLLPSSPNKFIHYFSDNNMPQTKLSRDLDKGMAISVGRLREDSQYQYKFICLSHNTIRGAAGGAILMAELLHKNKFLYK
ncbi:MAG: aspartate-semialdehyde dehydrogenase [Oscillospiraceae bacterium]